MNVTNQNKNLEVEFFQQFNVDGEYDRFSEASYKKLIELFSQLIEPRPGQSLLDMGCGSGAFTSRLHERHPTLKISGVDLTPTLIKKASRLFPDLAFNIGDIENLQQESASVDIITYFGVLHHFPDFTAVAKEAHRLLKPGGQFFSFDPHHFNPLFWLYRAKESPFYSSKGVSQNERLITPREVHAVFQEQGFKLQTQLLCGLRFEKSSIPVQKLLTVLYNSFDGLLAATPLSRSIGPWVIGWGEKK